MAMEPSAASAAARQQASSGFFTFLKHGAVLPARNGALFVPLLVLTAALAAALLLGNAVSVQPLAAAVLLDADAISRVDLASAAYRELVRAFQSDLRRLLLAGGGCLLGAVVAGSAIKIATVFAAVAAFSAADRRATVAAALGAARANFWGPVLTVAFEYVLELACAAAIVALAVLAVVLLDYSLLLLFFDALLALLASLFLVYLTVVCSVAVAVSAAEPGRCGAGTVGRAWRWRGGPRVAAHARPGRAGHGLRGRPVRARRDGVAGVHARAQLLASQRRQRGGRRRRIRAAVGCRGGVLGGRSHRLLLGVQGVRGGS
jgi:hypothetical protein